MTKNRKLKTIEETLKWLKKLTKSKEELNLTANEVSEIFILQGDLLYWKIELQNEKN